jgi:predicted alpha/beta superfamily hydrolase
MEIIKRFQIRDLHGEVHRADFNGRIVDFWAPEAKTEHIIVAHDGQNIFDRKTATHGRTWKLAQTATRIFREHGFMPPLIIGVFHGTTKENPWGRAHDLAPQDPFQKGLVVSQEKYRVVSLDDLHSNAYLDSIVKMIVPQIWATVSVEATLQKTALLGSSMGGLATLYGIGKHPDFFGAGLSFSPHWVIGNNPLVDSLLNALPAPTNHRIWMARGTKGSEKQYAESQQYANHKMLQLGWRENENFASHIFKGDRHNEPSWGRQLESALNFWLRKS